MYQFDIIKLIIWDLDDTFWKGTISEGAVIIPEEHRQLLSTLTDIGIINSICSKNDLNNIIDFLKAEGLSEYFVFPSVDWNPKGARIKKMISDMQLRPANVLFIDDNPSNLGEAQYFCPEIMVGSPEIISKLIEDAEKSPKKDLQHKRLAQYRVLEKKHQAKETFSSNEEFLFESGIRVEIKHDCIENLERIHDLILRSNQLNFTKIRCSLDELKETLNDTAAQSGYVSVSDKFGDYGIVGFYTIKDNKAVHFVFSCRTLGMGIEQYVYNILKRPEITISGEVISDISSSEIPKWINNCESSANGSKMKIDALDKHQVLIKGPCDLFQIFPYIADTELFDTEFTYTLDNGLTIESTGHTTHIVESLRLNENQKKRVLDEVPFTHEGMYNNRIFTEYYKIVFISILADCNLGVYRRKSTGERLAFLEYIHPLTDEKYHEGLISGEYPTAGFKFTKEILKKFSEQYEFIGRNSPDEIVENLRFIRNALPKSCNLVIMLGGELFYEKNTSEAYADRHLVHKQVNDKIRKWASESKNVSLMDVNKYLVDQSSFYDHFNHYIKPIYYALAGDMVALVNKCTDSQIRETSKFKMIIIRLKELLAPLYYKVIKMTRK